MSALKWTAAYGYGHPTQAGTIEHRRTLEELVAGSNRERTADAATSAQVVPIQAPIAARINLRERWFPL